MENCFDCVHAKDVSYFDADFNFVFLKECAINKDLCNKFVLENQRKTRSVLETLPRLDCYKPTEIAEMLDNMIDLAQEIKGKVREHRK